jgi:hypothetical protein
MPRDLFKLVTNNGDGDDGAVDDADDELDDGLVELQRSISNKRREGVNNASPIQKIMPFPYAPNVRPLTGSDVDSCVALENAAFPNKHHRASRETVSLILG